MISKPYLDLLRTQPQPSRYAHDTAEEISRYCRANNIQTVLDWGCGHEHQLYRSANWPTGFREYDPAVAGYDQRPQPAELVVAIDVLQCVETQYVDRALQELAYLTETVLWLVIDLGPSIYHYDTGMNQNVTIKTREEWMELLRRHFTVEWMTYTASWMEMRLRPTASRRVTRLRTVNQWQQHIGRR